MVEEAGLGERVVLVVVARPVIATFLVAHLFTWDHLQTSVGPALIQIFAIAPSESLYNSRGLNYSRVMVILINGYWGNLDNSI